MYLKLISNRRQLHTSTTCIDIHHEPHSTIALDMDMILLKFCQNEKQRATNQKSTWTKQKIR